MSLRVIIRGTAVRSPKNEVNRWNSKHSRDMARAKDKVVKGKQDAR